jgi:hypothetical protein
MPMLFYLPIIIWGGLMAPYFPSRLGEEERLPER